MCSAPPEYGPLAEVSYLGTTVRAFARRPRSLSALLRSAATRWPDRTAVIAPAGRLTYAELDAAVDATAAGLHARGIGAGDRLTVAQEHDLAAYVVPWVCSRLGARALLLPPGRGGERLQIPAKGRAAPPVDDDEDRPVVLLGTSGTTGVPKTTMVTSRGLIHAALAYVELLGLRQDDRSLVVLGLHTIGPLSAQVTAMALVGGTCVLPADPRPRVALDALAEHAITHLDAVPAWLGLLAREDPRGLPAWRTLIYGGAPMPPRTAAALAEAYPGVAMFDVWGLSETHGPATADGRPVAGVEVRAVDGELQVRGANVTPGYVDGGAAISDGWLRTGDLGTVAADGTVRVLDRAKDVILRGGANVFSVQVEQVLCGAPGVVEAAVFGVPDQVGGEAVAAAVVLAGGAQPDVTALRQLVARKVGVHAVPRRFRVLDALPRNANGKIDKRSLREEGA